jgi:hypothetical protein
MRFGAAALAAALVAGPAAVARADTPAPWATINICDTAEQPQTVGVRVFAPERDGGAQWTRIRLQFYDDASGRWKRVWAGTDDVWHRLGSGHTARFGGRDFTFAAPDPGRRFLLRGLVDLQWRRGGAVTGQARVRTTGGHADPTDPQLQDSRAACEVR